MIMKRFVIFTIIFLCASVESFGQTLRVVQPERDNLNSESCQLLQTIMTEMLSCNDIVNNIPSNRFVLTAKADIVDKNIIAGSPSRMSERMKVTFIVGDVIKKMVFSTYSVIIVGVGETEQQAIRRAMRTIKPRDASIQSFIIESKEKIVRFYNDYEDELISIAENLATEGNFDEAIYELSLVPSACGATYTRCQEKLLGIIQDKYDVQGVIFLTEAKAIWASTLNRDGAEKLLPVIKQISPFAACHPQITEFLSDINTKLAEDDRREWEFMVHQYEEELRLQNRRLDEAINQADREMKLKELEVSSARDVAMEYARNQPDVVYQRYVTSVLLW